MKHRKTYILTIIFCLLTMSLTTSAQGNRVVVETGKDSVKLFRGIDISYDLAGTVMRMVSDYGQFEAAVRCNLRNRFFPIIEFGLGDAEHKEDIVTGVGGKVRAPYGRIGMDLNMAKSKNDSYRILVGARYGFTSFKTEIDGTVEDPYWGGTDRFRFDLDRCKFHWMELLFAVDGKLWGPVRLGWSVRYRRMLHKNDMGVNNLWYVPGFGKYSNKIGATFNVMVSL